MKLATLLILAVVVLGCVIHDRVESEEESLEEKVHHAIAEEKWPLALLLLAREGRTLFPTLYRTTLEQTKAKLLILEDKGQYREAIRYARTLTCFGEKRPTAESTLYKDYVMHLFSSQRGGAALAILDLKDGLYRTFTNQELRLVEERILREGARRPSLGDVSQELRRRRLSVREETTRRLEASEAKTVLLEGVVTVWVDKGIVVKGGVGVPDIVIGSGFFIDKEGHVLTNYHVVESEVDPRYEGYSRLFLKLDEIEGEKIPARVVGWDKNLDLALLKTEVSPQHVLTLSGEEPLSVGDRVFTIGSPGGLSRSLTSGRVSAKQRRFLTMGEVLQIDAPVNPGNSGGPLFNEDHAVIGVIFSKASPYFEGINFAIPSSLVQRLLPKLYDGGGKVVHVWMGVAGYDTRGVLEVLYVVPGSPADKMGLQKRDKLQTIDGVPLQRIASAHKYLLALDPGTLARLTWIRGEKKHEGLLLLEKRPDLPLGEALKRDTFRRLVPALFGMDLQWIKRSLAGTLYEIQKVYPGMAGDNSGVTRGDKMLLIKQWEESKALHTLVRIHSRKEAFYEKELLLLTPLLSERFF